MIAVQFVHFGFVLAGLHMHKANASPKRRSSQDVRPAYQKPHCCNPSTFSAFSTSKMHRRLEKLEQVGTCSAMCVTAITSQSPEAAYEASLRDSFSRTFFRQAAVKQGETRDRSLRARRPTGVRQDIALQRRAGVRVANVGGELAEARSERSLRCDCEHLPPPAPVRGCDSRALRRGAGESSALRDAVEEGLSLLAPSFSNFEGRAR